MTSSVTTLRQNFTLARERRPDRAHSHPRFKVEGDRPLSTEADRINGSTERAVLFGPFRLLPTQRLLLRADKPAPLGSRALDILIALVERPGELVSKDELMARVWPNLCVVPANLAVQLGALRRALGDGRDGSRFIISIPGQGYRFVAPVTFAGDQQPSVLATEMKGEHNLPARLTRLIGRADIIDDLAERLSQRRLLTIVGPGGIGKTAVALSVAEQTIKAFEHGVWLIELAHLGDPSLVPGTLAAALGLEIGSEKALPALVTALRDKQMLLVLDNCEQVISAAAEAAVNVLRRARGVQILATSREPLRVEGEHVHRLSQLESPPASASLTASDALAFPTVQLFVEHAAASLGKFELDDADAPLAAKICRSLDGNPLAIEFAAARAGAIGLRGVAAHMDDGLRLLTDSHRTRPSRQLTMRATLDWSYGLLTEIEQAILRRLSLFADTFTFQAAATIAADSVHSEREVIDTVLRLVAKSLITADMHGAEPHLRLPGLTRAYLRAKLDESGERDTIYSRQGKHYRDSIGVVGPDGVVASRLSSVDSDESDNISPTLAWTYPSGSNGRVAKGFETVNMRRARRLS
jgi:predicted ATPase/DNA-binding winged helix-turn-helix (wHTH) protein